MSKNLVIVESPAKAKTIEKYLGSDFRVMSSVGHIRGIIKKPAKGQLAIDTKNGFETIYEVDSEKKKIISELKKAAKASEEVWLATDEDREGEAIAWHLCEVLKLNINTTKRIVFHEITKSALDAAIKKPRTLDMDLVRAQQARQILDRLVGFELSPVVWRKVPGGKSAGRVQSPAVRLLVEREREIESFNSSFSFKVIAEFTHSGEIIKAELSDKFSDEQGATDFLKSLINSSFTVSSVTTNPTTRNPGAPFTTSTLQQEANSKLGFSAKATMSSAQKLYQDGKITYMRTDSLNLSSQAIAQATEYIKSTFGDNYSTVRKFKTKNSSAQEAHEAIRPTDIRQEKASNNEYEQKLYDLIRRRTLSSQMAPAKLEKTTITIDIKTSNGETLKVSSDVIAEVSKTKKTKDTVSPVFEAKGEIIVFDGFLRIYSNNKKDDGILPNVNNGDLLTVDNASAKQVFARPPARFSEGSLVKKLEDLGIGRPSTYATIINTIQVRGYVEKGENEGTPRDIINLNLENNDVSRVITQEKTGSDRGKLVPTPSGEVVSDFLTDHFDQIVDYGFTAEVEESFDKIATGAIARNSMLTDFYLPFHKLIEESGGIDRSQVAKAREIGTDPKTGKTILARFGRFGPMLQLGDGEDKEVKLQFAPIPAGKKIETVTLEDALKAFQLPRIVGSTPEGLDIKANIGRFGPYIQIDKLFVSIKPFDPHTITLDESLKLYAEKLQAEKEKNIADFGDGIKVLKGRYGPYITDGSKNVKIPKTTEPTSITHEEAKKMIAEAPAGKKKRIVRKKAVKKTAKKTTKKAVKKTK